MYNYNKFNQPYFNLLIEHDPQAWENGFFTFKKDRFLLYSYGNKFQNNDPVLHSEYLEEIKSYPCLFLYEELSVEHYNLQVMGYIGYITSAQVNFDNITINFVKEEALSPKDVHAIEPELQVSDTPYGLNRSQWSIKNGNIYQFIDNYRPHLENQDIATRPRVFFSYSWDFESTKIMVDDLAANLTRAGVEVIYDKSHLKPGQSLNYFMEKLNRDDFTKVYIFCDSSYLEKAKIRSGGVGKEVQLLSDYGYNNPEQRKIIPLFIEDECNYPSFLDSPFGFRLQEKNWSSNVEDILKDIFSN